MEFSYIFVISAECAVHAGKTVVSSNSIFNARNCITTTSTAVHSKSRILVSATVQPDALNSPTNYFRCFSCSLLLQSRTLSHHWFQWIGHMARDNQGGHQYCMPDCRHIIHWIRIATWFGTFPNGIDERRPRQTIDCRSSTPDQPLFLATTWEKFHFGRSSTIDLQELLLFHSQMKWTGSLNDSKKIVVNSVP